MAWRIDSSSDYLRRTASLPATTSFSACGWCRVVTDRTGQYRFIFGLENTAHPTDSSAWMLIGWNNSNNFYVTHASISDVFASNPSTTDWFFWALTCSGTATDTFNGYWRAVDGTALNNKSSFGVSFTPAQMMWSNDTFDEYVDCRHAGLKVWDAALTAEEILVESFQLAPVRRANLHLFAPGFAHDQLDDMSGNGRTLTAGGTLTTEEGPPVPLFIDWDPGYVLPGAPAGPDTVDIAGALSFGGALARSIEINRSGASTPAGAYASAVETSYSGVLTSAAALASEPSISKAGSVGSSGAASQTAVKAHTETGVTTPSGAISQRTDIAPFGSVGPDAVLALQSAKSFVGSVSSSATVSNFAAKLLSAAGAVSPDGAVVHLVDLPAFAGSVSFSGARSSQPQIAIQGMDTPSGSVAPLSTINVAIAGALTSAAALTNAPDKLVAGELTPTGLAAAGPNVANVGALDASGVFSSVIVVTHDLGGAISPSAAAIASAVSSLLDGGVTPAGAFAAMPNIGHAGALSFAGALANNVVQVLALAGAVTSDGELDHLVTAPSFDGDLTPAGAPTQTPIKATAGSIAGAGTQLSVRVRLLSGAGALSSAGSVIQTTGTKFVAVSGALTSAGALALIPIKALSAALTSSGAASTMPVILVPATLDLSGDAVSVKVSVLAVAGALTSSAGLAVLPVVDIPLDITISAVGVTTATLEDLTVSS